MYAFAEKTDEKRVQKNKNEVLHKKLIPAYIYEQRDATKDRNVIRQENVRGSGAVTQRYPVRSSGDGVIRSTSKRPYMPSSEEFFKGLYDRLQGGCRNEFEEESLSQHPDRDSWVGAFLYGNYRSLNGIALCHIISISDFERIVVDCANEEELSPGLSADFVKLNIDGPAWINSIMEAGSTEEKVVRVNEMIERINETPQNYCLGDSRTNASIGKSFDPHLDSDGAMTPRSQAIYEHMHEINITPPKIDSQGNIISSSRGRE